MVKKISTAIIGGGAAGFFAAIFAKKKHPNAHILILEKNAALLSKVRVSGGGRCNVTHACFEPSLLVKNYPRGSKELLGPFHQFQPKDTVKWFEARGVFLKTEADGRMFPKTDSSQTIIDCFMSEVQKLGIDVLTQKKIINLVKNEDAFLITLEKGESFIAQNVILATGSSPKGYEWAKELGHIVEPPTPSLFTFNSPNSSLKKLRGISFEEVLVQIVGTPFKQTGPLLITHFGFSGPAILKLSAWAAKELFKKSYSFEIKINWLPNLSLEEIKEQLFQLKEEKPKRKLLNENLFKLPKNFWKHLLEILNLSEKDRLHDISIKDISTLAANLHHLSFKIEGKTTHKEEFVTCGGIRLKEVDFKTMESKICPHLFFAGEILDIDGVTGGFNFQNAWTTGFIAGSNT